jgi:hypothetical protein
VVLFKTVFAFLVSRAPSLQLKTWGPEAWLVHPWECLKIPGGVPGGHLQTSRLRHPKHRGVTTEVRKAHEQASMVKKCNLVLMFKRSKWQKHTMNMFCDEGAALA